MTENTSAFTTPPGQPGGTGPGGTPGDPGGTGPGEPPRGPSIGQGVVDDLRALRRSRDDRVLAGVCGGLARRLGLDPLLLRILTAVLAIFGGIGILLYALAWLLIPEDGGDDSVLEQTFGRGSPGQRRTGMIVLTIALIVVSLVAAGVVFDGPFDRMLLLILAVIGLIALLRRGEGPRPAPAAYPGPAAPGAPPAQTAAFAAPPASTVTTPTAPAGPDTRPGTGPEENEPGGEPGETPAGPGTQEFGAPPPYVPFGAPPFPAEPPPPPTPKPRSILFPLVMSAALVAVGLLAMADHLGADVPAGAYVALPLAVVGGGLIVAAWYGRGAGLAIVGVLLGVGLIPASAADAWNEEDHDVLYTPTSVTEATGSYDHRVGRVVWDLRGVDFPARTVELELDHGVGRLLVIVPEDLDVELDVALGIGEVIAFGDDVGSGFGVDRSLVDVGPDGPGGGRLALDIEQGIGSVEVRREPRERTSRTALTSEQSIGTVEVRRAAA